jgi:hypothetical protein
VRARPVDYGSWYCPGNLNCAFAMRSTVSRKSAMRRGVAGDHHAHGAGAVLRSIAALPRGTVNPETLAKFQFH